MTNFAQPTTVAGIYQLAQAARAVADDALATTAGGTPERSYVAPATPIYDCCPFVCVWMPAVSEENTSPFSPPAATGNRQRYGRINLISLNITVVRCAPETSDADEIEVVAMQVMEDAWALWCGFHNALQDGTFLSLCDDVHFDRLTSIPERGKCVGVQLTLRANLGGIKAP